MKDAPQIKIGFVCPKTGRVAVLLSEYAKSDFNGETSAYIYDQANEDFDPWATIESVDVPVEGNSFDVWFENGSCKQGVGGDTIIFVRASIAQSLKEARA